MRLLDYFRSTCDHEWEEETQYELSGARSIHVSEDGRLYAVMITQHGQRCAKCGVFESQSTEKKRCYFDYVDTKLLDSSE